MQYAALLHWNAHQGAVNLLLRVFFNATKVYKEGAYCSVILRLCLLTSAILSSPHLTSPHLTSPHLTSPLLYSSVISSHFFLYLSLLSLLFSSPLHLIHILIPHFYSFPSPSPSLSLSLTHTQDKVQIIASDPLTAECYTLSIEEDVSSMPMGEQVASILLPYKQYTDRMLNSVHTSRHHLCVGGKDDLICTNLMMRIFVLSGEN
jgi:hypothetical protein